MKKSRQSRTSGENVGNKSIFELLSLYRNPGELMDEPASRIALIKNGLNESGRNVPSRFFTPDELNKLAVSVNSFSHVCALHQLRNGRHKTIEELERYKALNRVILGNFFDLTPPYSRDRRYKLMQAFNALIYDPVNMSRNFPESVNRSNWASAIGLKGELKFMLAAARQFKIENVHIPGYHNTAPDIDTDLLITTADAVLAIEVKTHLGSPVQLAGAYGQVRAVLKDYGKRGLVPHEPNNQWTDLVNMCCDYTQKTGIPAIPLLGLTTPDDILPDLKEIYF